MRFAQGRDSEAITQLTDALRLNPYNADAHSNLGCALQRLGDREQAMVHFRTAIRLQPDHALAHYNMGLFMGLDFDEALRELQTARRLLPDRPEIPFKLGVLLSDHGRYSEACANFAEALRLRPDSDEVRQYLRFLRRKAPQVRNAVIFGGQLNVGNLFWRPRSLRSVEPSRSADAPRSRRGDRSTHESHLGGLAHEAVVCGVKSNQ